LDEVTDMQPQADVRSRSFSWQDPRATASAARELSGLAFLEAIRDGRIPPPPIARVLGMDLVEVEHGRAVFTLQPAEHQYNPIGSVHGGVMATVLDSALACAVHSTLPVGTGYTTVQLNVQFVRGVSADSPPLRCEAKVVHVGGRMATSEARLVDAQGTLYAHATTVCLVLRPSGGKAG
jgi:uncharacterized protein (TIGR00369 family)